jgi:hypothetical protein
MFYTTIVQHMCKQILMWKPGRIVKKKKEIKHFLGVWFIKAAADAAAAVVKVVASPK